MLYESRQNSKYAGSATINFRTYGVSSRECTARFYASLEYKVTFVLVSIILKL